MFSDIISDSIAKILDNLNPDYANPSIYPPEVVINMIAAMITAQLVSDARAPDGTFWGFSSIQDIQRHAAERAQELYELRF